MGFPNRDAHVLRVPAVMLFISHDTCSDSIAKLLGACFNGYRTIIARCAALYYSKYQRGAIAAFWGAANLPEKASRDMGYRSDSIAISRDMGPLSTCEDQA